MMEVEIHNYEQGERRAYQEESHDALRRRLADRSHHRKTKTESELAAMGGTAETTPMLCPKLSKVTFDVCQISKTKAQTKVMLLLIPEDKEGQLCCQSVQMSE
jgi:hypothetical protein